MITLLYVGIIATTILAVIAIIALVLYFKYVHKIVKMYNDIQELAEIPNEYIAETKLLNKADTAIIDRLYPPEYMGEVQRKLFLRTIK